MNKENLLITGSSGMIGHALKFFLKKSKKLKVFSPKKNELNLLNSNAFNNYLKKNKITSIIHCAAINGGTLAIEKNKIDFFEKNTQMSINLISAAKKNSIQNLLNISSSSIYPEIKGKFEERFLLSGPLEKTNEPYSLAKIFTIKLCEYYNEKFMTNYKSLVFCNVFGPKYSKKNIQIVEYISKEFIKSNKKNSSKIIFNIQKNLSREFIYLDDAIRVISFFYNKLLKKKINENYLNMPGFGSLSIKDLIMRIKKISRFKGKVLIKNHKNKKGALKKTLNSKLSEQYYKFRLKNLNLKLKLTYKFFKKKYI